MNQPSAGNHPRNSPRRIAWTDLVIVGAAVMLGVGTVMWADGEFRRDQQQMSGATTVALTGRMHWQSWYNRLRHDGLWVVVALTLGVGAVLARAGRLTGRRGLRRPGSRVVLVILIVGGLVAVHFLLAAPLFLRRNGICAGLHDMLSQRVPGAIVGAWVVGGLGSWRRADWRERLARVVGWLWLVNVGFFVAAGFLFG